MFILMQVVWLVIGYFCLHDCRNGLDWSVLLWQLAGLGKISMGVDNIGHECGSVAGSFRIPLVVGSIGQNSFLSKELLWIGQISFTSRLDWSEFPWEWAEVGRGS